MATISDVAKAAGLSTATVSRALNGVSTVNPDLVSKVLQAANELGYQPHGPARNLRRKRTSVIALLISDVENPYFTSIARGVEDVARSEEFSVVLCNCDEDPAKERGYLDVALGERMAGVIISPTSALENAESAAERGMPLVAVDRPLPPGSGDCVLVDTRDAAREATRHLADSGYARIACLTGPQGVSTAEDRLAGYRDGLRRLGRRVEADLVRRAPYRAAGAHAAMGELLDADPAPDAVLVANNAMAIGTLEALSQRGLRPGRDIGVVAFDDAPWAPLIDPPLSVVSQPAYDIGATAAKLLLERIGERDRPSSTTTLSARLLVRASSRR